MKHVRCKHCEAEYYVCEELNVLGFPLGGEQCEICGETDYLIIDDDVQVVNKNDYDYDDVFEDRNKDIISRLTLLRNEIDDIIDIYR